MNQYNEELIDKVYELMDEGPEEIIEFFQEKFSDDFLNNLYKTSSICGFCGKQSCLHEGNRNLKQTLTADDVLKAVDETTAGDLK